MAREATAPLDTAADIWEHFVLSEGVKPAHYDDALVNELRHRLQLPVDGDLTTQLRSLAVTPEKFVPALLGSLAPFARMMSDLCAFFVKHNVSSNGTALRIAFDFSQLDQRLEFDLTHFQRWLDVFTSAWSTVHEHAWNSEKLRGLQTILGKRSRSSPLAPNEVDTFLWLQREMGRGDQPWLDELPVVPIPSEASEAIRRSIERVRDLVLSVMRARSVHFTTYGELREWYRANDRSVDDTAPEPIAQWTINRIVNLERDRFCGITMQLLWGWMHQLPIDTDSAVHENIARCLNQLFDSLPSVATQTRAPLATLLSALELPVWGQRHALYAAWLMTVIEGAFDGSPIVINDDDGVLRIGPSESCIGTFQLGLEQIESVAELYSLVAEPDGKGRTGGIKPDFVLRPAGTTDTALTHVVIEAKQYIKPNSRSFADAINDYAKGHPNAEIILLDYGRMSSRVDNRIKEQHKPRAHALGNVQPQFPDEVRHAQAVIAAPMAWLMGADMTIIVDVSGSMGPKLQNDRVREDLRLLATRFSQATWIAFDTEMLLCEKGPVALESIFALDGGGTDLAAALSALKSGSWLVITDGEGLPQVTASAPDCEVCQLRDDVFAAASANGPGSSFTLN